MSRAARLLDLVQALRRRRRPAPGRILADELGVSLRTLYRDIDTLRAQGAPIDGEAGLGYVLKPGFTLPPLMFTHEEIDAVTLGLRFVTQQADARLAQAAAEALAKIAAVLPQAQGDAMEATPLLVGPRVLREAEGLLALLRDALRAEVKVDLLYRDRATRETRRRVWPIAIGFFDDVLMLAAWCELRADFRHFRLERMVEAQASAERLPLRRRTLMRRWREAERRAADGN